MVQRINTVLIIRMIVAVLICTATILSCKPSGGIDLLVGFDAPLELQPYRSLENVFLKRPYGLLVRDSVIISWESSEGNQVSLNSAVTGESLMGFLFTGRGPGEATHVDDLYLKGDSLYASVYPERLFSYNWNDLIFGETIPETVYDIEGVFTSNRITAFTKNLDDEDNSTMYRTTDTMDGSITYWSEFPEDDPNEYPLNDYSKQLAYQGHFYAPRNQNKAIFLFDTYAIGYDVLDLEHFSVEHHISCYPQVKMEYYPEFDITRVDYADKYQEGFRSAAANDSGFYLLYVDEDLFSGSYVLSFDWDSKPQRLFHVKESLTDICVDDDNDFLYGIDEEESLDGIRIVIYVIEKQ